MEPYKHLDTQIECLKQQMQQDRIHQKSQPESIKMLYESTQGVLKEFDTRLIRCKKYNEAKIHRKYEIAISSLTDELKAAKQQLKMEKQTKPNSKKYVSDLICKMVSLRDQNTKLRKQLSQYQKKLPQQDNYPFQNDANSSSSLNPQHIFISQKRQWKNIQLSRTVDKFLLEKAISRKKFSMTHSDNLEKFFRFNFANMHTWDLYELFEKLDKWSMGFVSSKSLDEQKRKNIIDTPAIELHKEYNSSQMVPFKQKNKLKTISYLSNIQRKKHQNSHVYSSQRKMNIEDSYFQSYK